MSLQEVIVITIMSVKMNPRDCFYRTHKNNSVLNCDAVYLHLSAPVRWPTLRSGLFFERVLPAPETPARNPRYKESSTMPVITRQFNFSVLPPPGRTPMLYVNLLPKGESMIWLKMRIPVIAVNASGLAMLSQVHTVAINNLFPHNHSCDIRSS